MQQPQSNIIQFKSFSAIPGVIHGFSTRPFGSMNPKHSVSEKSLELFLKSLKINPKQLVRMKQVHSSIVRWVSHSQTGQTIDQTDGILTSAKNIFLSVLSADCLPILIFDTQKKYAGVVHAGWKGIYNEILKSAINHLIAKGSEPSDIIVGIGPSIRSCCYNVSEDRAKMFTQKFSHSPNFLKKQNNKTFLDLISIAKQQLQLAGIPKKNIEDISICTSDNIDILFSFRKEGKNFGEFIGIIGIP